MCLSSAEEAEYQLYVLEAIIVELKVGVLIHLVCSQRDHSGGWQCHSLTGSESLGSIRVLMLQTMACYKRQHIYRISYRNSLNSTFSYLFLDSILEMVRVKDLELHASQWHE